MECIADNICSPLGWTTNENFARVMHGESKLTRHDDKWNLPRPFVASLFPDGAIAERFSTISTDAGRYTRFEQLAILSISYALAQTHIDAADKRVLFVLSTTKGNVELLDDENLPSIPRERIRLGKSAAVIARFFGNPNQPVVVSNACISGVCAQATAHRLMQSGRYTHAVVCGCDVQSKFIVSGFQSFKALSSEPCRPFDAHRTGLNLGEAAATMILRADESTADGWTSGHIAIRNDANHISGPSRTGEGSFRALRRVLPDDTARLAFVNLHGTATPYNDEMESFAIARAGLLHTPVNALKGYYGHTMGAAGVLETILSMRAVEAGTIIPTRGFGTLGVSNKLNIISRVHLCSESVELNGRPVITFAKGSALLAELYKQVAVNYPKFYKMDTLSRLGFIASELLLSDIDRATLDDCAVMLVGRTGCLLTDQKYQTTIQHTEQFYPSP
ncbi:MAG: 3-oxoacyl-ACP synthase, partial [Prevotella micans]|nr:3-oxoacyl-ACP synthase [Prevotella micans]